MKKASTPFVQPLLHRNRIPKRGVVLILVLAFLVLITTLILAFFLSVSTELSASKGYANGSNARELADSAVQAIIGQIRLATASTDNSGNPIVWASQPGMIRTFSNTGVASAAYKLYSSNNMIVSGTPTAAFTDDFDSTWTSTSTLNTALYTDLNSPVVSGGNLLFPIIDPRAAGVVSGTYSLVDGFSYTGTFTGSGTTVTIPGLAMPSSSTDTTARVPMPVKWIYLLKDGTMTVPNSGSGTTATWTGTGTNVPSATNPIVGRIAFWTDDETCKLNVNTACGGTYWDGPRFSTGMDLAYSRYKPVANEFNRFPGHPATTSLLPVFWSYAGLTSPDTNLVPLPNVTAPLVTEAGAGVTDAKPSLTTLAGNAFQSLLNFSPRNAFGGSQLGTVATTGYNAAALSSLTSDADRLYATVDEALFAAPEASPAVPNSLRIATGFTTSTGTTTLAASDVEKLRFFLTASSHAPEMNPFNLPKISMWPVPQAGTGTGFQTRTPTDNLLAFCSTLNGNPYYFTRANSLSATADWTTRNGNLFSYLTNLWAKPIPGFGGTLQSRYTLDGDNRLLTMMYDYLRSTVNIFDTYGATSATGPFNSAFMAQTNYQDMGFGQVTPISITAANGITYKGLGRFPGIKQVAIMFIATAANQPPLMVVPSGNNVGRPLLVDVNGNSLLDSSYNLTRPAGVTDVLTGKAYAVANPMHAVVGNPVSPVPQVMSGQNPALAVNPTKLAANPNDPTAIYPVFNPVNCYPTLGDANSSPTATSAMRVQLGGGTTTGTFTESGTPYTYSPAAYVYISTGTSTPPTAVTSSSPYPPQTHAGLPYLTVQRPSGASVAGNMEGAYDLPNPRYQGKPNAYTTLPDATMGTGTLTPGLTQVQAIILIDPVDPAAGTVALSPAFQVEITGIDGFTADTLPMNFPSDSFQCSSYKAGSSITSSYGLDTSTISMKSRSPTGSGSTLLSFVSSPILVGGSSLATSGSTFAFTGGNIVVNIYAPDTAVANALTTSITNSTLVQSLNLNFPSTAFPTPLLPPMMPGAGGTAAGKNIMLATTNAQYTTGITANAPASVTDLCPSCLLTFDTASALCTTPDNGVGGNLYAAGSTHIGYYQVNDTGEYNYILPERTTSAYVAGAGDYHAKLTADTVRSIEVLYGDTRVASSLASVPAKFYAPNKYYFNTAMRSAHSFYNYRGATSNFLSAAYLTTTGWNYDTGVTNANGRGLVETPAAPTTDILNLESPLTSTTMPASSFPSVTSSTEFDDTIFGANTGWSGLTKFSTIWTNGGDFENGNGADADSPTIGKMNEADMEAYPSIYYTNPDYYPAMVNGSTDYKSAQAFSPNRLVPSPLIFGSLPIPVDANTPGSAPDPTQSWRTLLFCPNPVSYDITKTNNASQTRTAVQQVTDAGSVPNGTTAPDHLFLDFFNMPVVAPYAISEPFSTAGKVNMNYQIAPFSYIKRTTALRGVLRDSVVTAVNDQWVGEYKVSNTGNGTYFTFLTNSGQWGFRYPIDATDTLAQFDQRFSNNDLFRSPSEICSLWIYPATQPTSVTPEAANTPLVAWDSANANIKSWWYSGSGTLSKSLTGDNERERPYATIYPRLTTKSNTYTVHFRVQVLQKVPTTAANEWVDGTDTIQSEYRGSSIIERYIDPSDTTVPDVATATTATSVPSLDANYKFRIVVTKRFAP